MKKIITSVATVTALAAATPAFAQAGPTETASASASAEIVDPIAITSAGSLSFGRIAADDVAGAVAVDSSGVLSDGTGNLLIAGAAGSVPTFSVTGEAGLAYTATVPASTPLNGPAGSTAMTVTLAKSGGNANLDAAGADSFKVTGSLAVGANQMAGSYNGSFAVTVHYN